MEAGQLQNKLDTAVDLWVGRCLTVYLSNSSLADDQVHLTHIVGMSCVYPGAASSKSVTGFWLTAINAEDLPMVIPFNRWAIEQYYDPIVTGVRCLVIITLSLLSWCQLCAYTSCVCIFLMQLERCMFDLLASSLM